MRIWQPQKPSLPLTATIAGMLLSSILAALLLPSAASAHFSKDVGNGQYRIQMGFQNEPTFAGQPNALYLKVEQYATGGAKPVNDLAATLKAEVTKDGQSYSQPLVPIGDGQYV